MSDVKRGVVLSPNVYREPEGSDIFVEPLDQHELRKYLTYWDMIEIPSTGHCYVGSSDISYLAKCGVLQRTPFAIQHIHRAVLIDSHNIGFPAGFAKVLADAHDAIYERLDEKEPGVWAKAHLSETFARTGEGTSKRYIEIDLHGVVPVPSENTPLDDILNFKVKRSDELLAFREHTDEIYQKVIMSPDEARALQVEKAKLEKSLIDIHRSGSDDKLNFVSGSVNCLASAVASTLTGSWTYDFANKIDYPLEDIAKIGIGVGAGLLTFSQTRIKNPANSKVGDLNYVKSISKGI